MCVCLLCVSWYVCVTDVRTFVYYMVFLCVCCGRGRVSVRLCTSGLHGYMCVCVYVCMTGGCKCVTGVRTCV